MPNDTGLVRTTSELGPYAVSTTPQPFTLNPRGDLSVAAGIPERTEIARMGNGWGAAIPTGSAFTFVAAWPTTRAELVLSNGESAGGKIYIIDRIWLATLTSITAAGSVGMLVQNVPVGLGIAVATDNAAVLRNQLSGNIVGYNGLGRLAVANTAFAVANKWAAVGAPFQTVATPNLGIVMESNVYGRYLVPPGGTFCLNAIGTAATGTAIMGVEWYEVKLASS